MQCVAVCCSVLQLGALFFPSTYSLHLTTLPTNQSATPCVLQCGAVCCSVVQCFAVNCKVFFYAQLFLMGTAALYRVCSTGCSVLQCVAVCCNVLQCVAVCCGVLQCVAVCCNGLLCFIYV